MQGINILEVNGVYYVLLPNGEMNQWYGKDSIHEILEYQENLIQVIGKDIYTLLENHSVQEYISHTLFMKANGVSLDSPIKLEDYAVCKPNEEVLESIRIARYLLLTVPEVREYKRSIQEYSNEVQKMRTIVEINEKIKELNPEKKLKRKQKRTL